MRRVLAIGALVATGGVAGAASLEARRSSADAETRDADIATVVVHWGEAIDLDAVQGPDDVVVDGPGSDDGGPYVATVTALGETRLSEPDTGSAGDRACVDPSFALTTVALTASGNAEGQRVPIQGDAMRLCARMAGGWVVDLRLVAGARPFGFEPDRVELRIRVVSSPVSAKPLSAVGLADTSVKGGGRRGGPVSLTFVTTARPGASVPSLSMSAMTTYQFTVVTGQAFGAGTDADVYAELIGEGGTTGELVLDGGGNNFERGATDVLSVNAKDIGTVTRLRIRHNGSGVGAGWLLDSVRVRNQTSGGEWAFPCGRWLAADEDDGQISRELTPA